VDWRSWWCPCEWPGAPGGTRQQGRCVSQADHRPAAFTTDHLGRSRHDKLLARTRSSPNRRARGERYLRDEPSVFYRTWQSPNKSLRIRDDHRPLYHNSTRAVPPRSGSLEQGMAARPLRGRLVLYSTSSPLVQSTHVHGCFSS